MHRQRPPAPRWQRSASLLVTLVLFASVAMLWAAARAPAPTNSTKIVTQARQEIELNAVIANRASALGPAGPTGPFTAQSPGWHEVNGVRIGPTAVRAIAERVDLSFVWRKLAGERAASIQLDTTLTSAAGWSRHLAAGAPAQLREDLHVAQTFVRLDDLYSTIGAIETDTKTSSKHFSLDVTATLSSTNHSWTPVFHLDVTSDQIRLPTQFTAIDSMDIEVHHATSGAVTVFGHRYERDHIWLASFIGLAFGVSSALLYIGRERRGWGLPYALRMASRYRRLTVPVDEPPLRFEESTIAVESIPALSTLARREGTAMLVYGRQYVVRGKGATYVTQLPKWAAPLQAIHDLHSVDETTAAPARAEDYPWMSPSQSRRSLVLDLTVERPSE